jgi:ARG/rhodanese/phosphatase superfamily protein
MQTFSLAAAGLAILGAIAMAPHFAIADDTDRISGPHIHENLAVYFIHGPSAPGPVPLTLQEALDKGSVRVIETGEVNELKIENTGGDEIFIQSGDIVKGGRQDRVLSMSFVLPPKSGEVSLAAFCVEHGRWSGRGGESSAAFASADEALPSREAKLAMRAPMKVEVGPDQPRAALDAGDRVYSRQQEVWASVASVQERLSGNLSAAVASPQSATSLQLSLENDKLKEAREAYIKTLESFGAEKDDILGYVFAVNGKVNSADVYPSNALFRKMWPKLLAASITEAIGADKDAAAAPAPAPASVSAFLSSAESGSSQEETVSGLARQEVRDAKGAVFMEAKRSDGAWVHRNYLAK